MIKTLFVFLLCKQSLAMLNLLTTLIAAAACIFLHRAVTKITRKK